MEQIAVSFTDGWVPKTWLTPKVTIIDRAWNTYIEDWELKELWYWWYIYNFDRYSPEKVYLYLFDWWDELEGYDRYIFGWNELDAYSNKYSWGRTAAPYFTAIDGKFEWINKAINKAVKSRKDYDDKEVRKSLAEIKKEIKGKGGYDVYKKLDSLDKILKEVKQSVVDTSSTNDGNNSKNFWGINGKLDLMAEYVVKIKDDIDNQLSTLDEDVANRIQESNDNINEWMSNRVTIEQLLQQVERLENKLNEVVDSVVSKRLPRELTDKFDVNVSRKAADMSDDEIMQALWLDMWLSEWVNEGLNEGMELWMSEWMEEGMEDGLWLAREGQSSAPVDMQGIAEPTMPLWVL